MWTRLYSTFPCKITNTFAGKKLTAFLNLQRGCTACTHVAAYEFAISCLCIYDIIMTTLWNDYAKECANHKQYRIGSQLPLSLHQFPFVAFVLSESLEMRHWLMTVVHQQKLPSHKYSKYNPPQSYNPTNVKIPLSAYSYTTSFNSSMFSHVNTVTDLDLKLINWLWFDLLYEQTMRGQIKASTTVLPA